MDWARDRESLGEVQTESEIDGRVASPSPSASPSAWLESVFRTHAAFVVNTLRRFGVPRAELSDQLQEVFLVVHRKGRSYDATRPLRPWLFGIAYRVAARYRYERDDGEKTDDVEDVALTDPEPLPDAVLESRQAQELVLAALERVELSRRAVLILADLEGETVPAIAEALDLPLNTTYSRLRLARDEFTRAVRRLAKRRDAGGDFSLATEKPK